MVCFELKKKLIKTLISLLIVSSPLIGEELDHLISTQEVELTQDCKLEGWFDDYQLAMQKARELNHPLLIAFLGPNWCPSSDELETEVLIDPSFHEAMQKEATLLKVDIPQNYNRETEDSLPGLKLKEKYGVDQCPCIVLVTPSGEEIAKLRNLPLKTAEFAEYIKEMLHDYDKIATLSKRQIQKVDLKQLKDLYVKAGKLTDTTFKKILLERGVQIDKSPYFLLQQYGQLISSHEVKDRVLKKVKSKIVSKDPKNEQGTRRKLAIIDFEALAEDGQKTESVIKPLIEYLKTFGGKDQKHAWEVEMKISKYLYSKNQISEALKYAKASLEIAPLASRPEIVQSIEYLQTQLPCK